MKHRISKIFGIQQPPDGYSELEEQLAKVIAENTIEAIYAKLPTNRMKAIVALHFELGYPQQTVGDIFGVDQSRIARDVEMIRKILLGHKYQKRVHLAPNALPKVDASDVIRFVSMMMEV